MHLEKYFYIVQLLFIYFEKKNGFFELTKLESYYYFGFSLNPQFFVGPGLITCACERMFVCLLVYLKLQWAL